MRLKLSSFCSKNGLCSKKEAKKLIQLGHLKLHGAVVREDTLVKESLSPNSISLAQRVQLAAANKVTVLLHKPECYLSTYSRRTQLWSKSLLVPENRCENDVQNNLNPSQLRRLLPINPLEYSSSGLALFSEDSSLIKRFADCEECYHVVFRDALTEPKLFALRSEIYIDGEAIPPLKVDRLSDFSAHVTTQSASSKVRVRSPVHSPKVQLRKACRLAGLEIRSIKRIRMGNIQLGDLLCGRWMMLRKYQLT
ncbi:pseudouridylate synthase [Babesia ovata]|uniref:Pseudouridylate synthase n=1 Tax=Babesia ovata TaxID=189622 RepID=A0A2H6KD56_9APIC|nr:pseudouridylate synthase [Babesia ovata]GBE60922.1 pseudouridylate synthase [Babesia ovata]